MRIRDAIRANFQAATGQSLNVDSATYRAAAENPDELSQVRASGALVIKTPSRANVRDSVRFLDAASIIGEDLAGDLEARSSRLVGRASSEDQLLNSNSGALVVKRRSQTAADVRAERFHSALLQLRSCNCNPGSRRYEFLRGNLDQVARQILLADGELPVDSVMLNDGLTREALINGMIRRGAISRSELGLPQPVGIERAALEPSGMANREKLPVQLDAVGNPYHGPIGYRVRDLIRRPMGLR